MRRFALVSCLFLLVSACSGPRVLDPRYGAAIAAGAPALQVGLPGRGDASVLRREMLRDGVGSWISPEGYGFYLRDGLLVGTRGIGEGLLSADVTALRAALGEGARRRVVRRHAYLGGDNGSRIRHYSCLIEPKGAREIALGAGRSRTRLVAETCSGAGETFENLYWLTEPGGRIVQSRQWMGPLHGALSTRVVP